MTQAIYFLALMVALNAAVIALGVVEICKAIRG